MRERRPQPAPRKVRAARLAASALLLLALPHAGARAQAGRPAPEAGARESVLFTALGKDGKFVEGLRAEDVRVSVDGAAREVLELKRQTGVPLLLAVVIDTSASQETVLSTTRLAADVFVRGMMEPGVDEAAVVTFAGETVLEQGLTGDVERVRAAIARVRFVPPPGYVRGGVIVTGPPPSDLNRAAATGLWDAVWVVANEVLPRSLGPGRRVVLLITDGVDTSSRVKSDKAIEAALQSEVVVYAVGVGDDRNFDGVDKGPLRKLTSRTGGRAFFPGKIKELTEIFIRVSRELTSQYVLTFAAPSGARDGTFHKLKIEPASPGLRGAGVQLSYPQGFYAGNAPTAVRQ